MDRATFGPSTRREYLKGGGALVGTGLLAGCAGDVDSESTTTTEPEATETETDAETDPYAVDLAPVGDVTFDVPPESAFVAFPQYADMAVALGHGDAVNTLYVPEMSGTTMNHYYHHLDGVSFEWEGLVDPLADGLSKEGLYELDSDVHFLDPAYAVSDSNWEESDVEEIAADVGPWFGNFYSGTRAEPPSYRGSYEYYGLWELFEKVAAVFREEERYRALESVHADLVASIEEQLPPEDERPTAVRVTLSDDQFFTYHLNEPGYWLADTRPLGANDAFADRDWSNLWGTVGYEAMAEADPDVILHLWGMTPRYATAEARRTLRDHPVGSQLSAVKNDRVYAQGMRYQGPIMNLFQLEMTAKQLYPEVFGEWPGYADGDPYPDIPADERLFDRDRVAAAVNGDR